MSTEVNGCKNQYFSSLSQEMFQIYCCDQRQDSRNIQKSERNQRTRNCKNHKGVGRKSYQTKFYLSFKSDNTNISDDIEPTLWNPVLSELNI